MLNKIGMGSITQPLPTNVSNALLLLLVSAIAYKLYSLLINPLGRIPGPFWSRFTSFALKSSILRGNRTSYIHSLHLKYGPYVRISPDEVSIADVDAAKDIYKIGTPYLKGKWYINFSGMFEKQNIFSTLDPKVHGHHRRLTARSFSDGWVSNMEPYIVKNVDLTVTKMSQEMTEKGYCDVLKWFTFMATDVIGEAAFGESFRMLESGKKSQYIHDLERETQRGILRSVSPTFAFLRTCLPFANTKEDRGSTERIMRYADESINRYWTNLRADPSTVKPTLLTKSYESIKDGAITHVQLRLDAAGYIVAGTDTTALAATQAVWLVAQQPALEQELIRAVAALPTAFTDADLLRVPLLQYVINETLRLKPSVSEALPRLAPRGGATLGGYFIPAGKTVGVQCFSLHRDPAIWDDPEAFEPMRWQSPSKEMMAAFLPFGGGSRVCIGSHFAQLELRHALARFYRSFPSGLRASKAEGFGEEDMETISYFLLIPKGKRCLLECRQ